MRDVPESISMGAATNGSPETESTTFAPPQKQESSMIPSQEEGKSGSNIPLPQTPEPVTTTQSLYSPTSKEPILVGGQRIDSPANKSIDAGSIFSRFPTMEEVSKYASNLANSLYQVDDEDEQQISDEVTVTSQYLTLKSLCTLPKFSADDIASLAYVMSAFQVNTTKDGRDDNTATLPVLEKGIESSEREAAANDTSATSEVADGPIPHLHEQTDDDSCDDDDGSVVLDIDAPVEEAEALKYIDAMEAAALELKYPDWSMHVVAQKHQKDCHIGMLFAKKTPTSPLIVQRVGGKGIFSSSDLLPGMVIREINRRPMAFGVGPEDAFLELRSAPPGEVSVLAEGLVCTVQRLMRKQKIGLKLKEDESGSVIVTKITNKSVFKDSNLQPGMTLQSINGQLCPLSAKAAKYIMKETIGTLQIVAIDGNKLAKERISMVESGKLNEHFQKQNKISIMTNEVSDAGQSSSAAPVEESLVLIGSETSILLHDDGLSASRYEVTVFKQETTEESGITFSRLNPSAPLTIETIDNDGLFGQSTLVEGMVVVSINGENMMWKDPDDAAKEVASCTSVTVVAEAYVTTVFKTDPSERVGMTLKKTTDGKNKIYIDQIPMGSKFSFTSLKPGMVLLTINGEPCPRTIKETSALFASVGVGELTIMAVNVDRQLWAQHKRSQQKQRSEEVMETLNALALSPSNSHSGMIFGNDSTEEEGAGAKPDP